MKKKIIKESKGITLIALVVTIIVLLILSAVAINLTIGSNGIFSRASEAVIVNENAEVYEQLQFKVLDYQVDNVQSSDENAVLSQLKSKGYVNSDNTINVEILMGKSMKTGNGTIENGDVYVLEESYETENNNLIMNYDLIYYNSKKEASNLGKVFTDSVPEDYLEPTSEDYFEFDESTGGIALKDADSYYESDEEIFLGINTLVIPSTYNGKQVKRIGIRYYNGEKDTQGHVMGIPNLADVETIIIPSSIEILGERSFSGCTGLKNIIIPDSVTTIEGNAFSGCTGLNDITIPDSVTSIGGVSFLNCTGLTNITLSNSITRIENYTFSNCTNLTNITIPESVTSIGQYAFKNCTGLTNITIPQNVTMIWTYAFSGCTGLTSVNIPKNITSISGESFNGCKNLINIQVDEENTKYDSRNNCNAIIDTENNELVFGCKTTVIPENVTSIGNSAFSGCTGLTSINIPENVTSIGSSAFSGCTGLTSINIPENVTSIGSSAFSGCTGLTSINIPENVTSIENSTFQSCTGLISINIPQNVTNIGWRAFSYCYSLRTITIPESVTSLDELAFYECTSLETINVPFNKGEQPAGWLSNWSNGCHATIVYANGETEQL